MLIKINQFSPFDFMWNQFDNFVKFILYDFLKNIIYIDFLWENFHTLLRQMTV